MQKNKIDYFITIFPPILIILLCILFTINPVNSNIILTKVRYFFSNGCSMFYLLFGLGVFIISLFIAFSKYGNITLGKNDEKPKYSFFQWGSMMFCAGLAADILFYSFSEWVLYVNEPYIQTFEDVYSTALTYSFFHWGFIPWSFYLTLASAFGFMMYNRNRNRQKYSESIRPILGKKVDGLCGTVIDIFAIFALIAGCATTFSLATPLMSTIITELLGIQNTKLVTILLLVITCICYISSLLNGLKGINFLSKLCMYVFLFYLLYVLVFSNSFIEIFSYCVKPIMQLVYNFLPMALNHNKNYTFAEDYTAFYWAYWMVWCIAAPFFIGQISKGRKIKQVILGGYVFGLLSTFISFIILSNWTMSLQKKGVVDLLNIYNQTGNLYDVILASLKTLPFKEFGYIVLFLSMLCFYATSFDSISLIASYYSYKNISINDTPKIGIKLFWAIMLILFPIALTFSDSSMANMQAVSIIAAFPIGIIIILILGSFFIDANKFLKGN